MNMELKNKCHHLIGHIDFPINHLLKSQNKPAKSFRFFLSPFTIQEYLLREISEEPRPGTKLMLKTSNLMQFSFNTLDDGDCPRTKS